MNAHGYTHDVWEVNEPQLKWIRRVKTEHLKEMLDPRGEASKTLPTQMLRLTAGEVTYKMYNQGPGIDCHFQGYEFLDLGKRPTQ